MEIVGNMQINTAAVTQFMKIFIHQRMVETVTN